MEALIEVLWNGVGVALIVLPFLFVAYVILDID